MRSATQTTAILLLSLSAALGTLSAGCADPREARAESEIQRLLGDDARAVSVSIEANRATLDGAVLNRASRTISEEIVLAQPGIGAVENRVTVAPRQPLERMYMDESDKGMLMRVEFTLLRRVGPRAIKDLQTRAVDGIVSLRGPVPSDTARKAILETTARVEDVRIVIDLMTVPEASASAPGAPPSKSTKPGP